MLLPRAGLARRTIEDLDRLTPATKHAAPVLAQRLSHRVAAAAVEVDHGSFDQARQQRKNVRLPQPIAHRDGLRGLEREASAKHRQPGEDSLLIGAQQCEAPLHGRLQGALPLGDAHAAAHQEAKAVKEAGQQSVHAHAAELGSRKLQRQRDAVKPAAHLGHGGCRVSAPFEPGLGEPRPLNEQTDRRRIEKLAGVGFGRALGQREGRHTHGDLARDLQRLAAGGDDA